MDFYMEICHILWIMCLWASYHMLKYKRVILHFFSTSFHCKMFISSFFFNDSSFLNDSHVAERNLIRKKHIEEALRIHIEVFNTLYAFISNYMLASPKNNNQPKQSKKKGSNQNELIIVHKPKMTQNLMPCQLKQLKELGTGSNCKPVMNQRPKPDIRPSNLYFEIIYLIYFSF